MFDINLVPEIQQQKQAQAKRNTVATIIGAAIVGAVVVTLVVLGSLKVAAGISLKNTQRKIDDVKAESEQYKELEETVLSIEAGLAGIKSTIDGQNDWTKLMPHLETATPSDIQYRSLGIEGTTITARLVGKNVDSVARFIRSYENYRVLVLTGNGTPQEEVTIALNDAAGGTAKVKSDGTWVYSMAYPGTNDFEVEVSGAAKGTVSYVDSTKSLKQDGMISARVANLFAGISTKQYSKEGATVNFDSTFTVLTEALW